MTATLIGTSAAETRRRRAARSPAYRAEHRRLQQFEEIARLVIMHRGQLGLSQRNRPAGRDEPFGDLSSREWAPSDQRRHASAGRGSM
jgi:hypothetical protein